MRFRIGAICVALLLAAPVAAQEVGAGTGAEARCVGRNLIAELPEAERAELDALVADVPYHSGILWRAERGDARVMIVGTYHFDDPRHAATVAKVRPVLEDAAALLVEGGPEEEARLQEALMRDPSLMVAGEGPTLRERLDSDEWAQLAQAMSDRGSPSVMTARFRPWYVSLMLGLSPCMIAQAQSGEMSGGLDAQLIDIASEAGIGIVALEPWDTLFGIFAGLSPEDEIDMIRVSLPGAALADDYAVTLADAYFAGETWHLWEFGRLEAYRQGVLEPDRIEAQMALAQESLMDARNRSWIAPLTVAAEAAGQGGHVVAAFGALHLPGENGVLRLLEGEGWTVSVWE